MLLGGLEFILFKLVASAVFASVVVIAVLGFTKVVEWFQNRQQLVEKDKDNVAFSVKQAMDNGQVGFITGIFNKRTENLVASEKFQAKQLDAELERQHTKNVMVYK